MGVYIPNMDAKEFGELCAEKGLQFIYSPVPPHGRLIDADTLMKSDRMVGKLMMYGGEYVYTQSEIDRAPTVIPAEEGE